MFGNWQQVKEVLAAVLEREPGDRLNYLNEVCTEPSLRREVESLLSAHEAAESVFRTGGAAEICVLKNGAHLGPYQILAPLGAGGMGEVYEALDTKLRRRVAIKVLPAGFTDDPERLARFQHEARMLAALNHPNIATIYGLENFFGVHSLIMELVPGQTLRERIAIEGPMPSGEALGICCQIAQALETAHAKGIIHRDLTPGNVKVTPEGQVKVLDFGLAKGFAGNKGLDLSNLTALTTVDSEAGKIVGTPPYMSPEQVRGKSVDNRADIWSFGCVLYELLTGQRAFRGETLADTISAVLGQEPDLSELPASTPTKIRDLLRRVLQKDVQQRLGSMAEARIEIELAQRDASAMGPTVGPVALRQVASDPSVGPSVLTHRRVRRWLPVLLTAVVLAAGIAVFGAMRERIRGWFEGRSIPQERQLAVLPFEVVGGDASTKAFADGLTTTLTAKLTQLTAGHQLQVVPARDVRASRVTSSESARLEFGVNLVLTGTLEQSAGMSRVTYELVDTKTRRQLRANTITIAAADPFAGEDEVTESVVRMLDLELQPAERQNLAKHETQVADAYDFYLQGRGYLEDYDKVGNVQNAITSFKRALETDPTYALAYTGLGEAYWQRYGESQEIEWVKPAEEACSRALAIDTRLAPAHVCMGTVASGTGQYQKAVTEFGRALELEPTRDDAYRGLAEAYEHLGNLQQAEATYRRAIALRPHYWAGYIWLGDFYYQNDRFSDAEVMFKRVIALVPEGSLGYSNLGATLNSEDRYPEAISVLQRSIDIRPTSIAYTNLGNAYFYLRRYAEAVPAYEQATKLKEGDYLLWWNLGDGYFWNPQTHTQAPGAYRRAISVALDRLSVNPNDSMAIGVLAICYAMVGDEKPAMKYVNQGLQLDPNDGEMRFKAALVYNQLGDVNEALTWLEKAVALGYSRTIIRDTPNFDLLRSNPRFQELLRAK